MKKPARLSLPRLDVLFRPMGWPRIVRRLFLVLVPVAIPLWCLATAVAMLSAIVRSFGRVLGIWWNGDRRRYRRYSYHGYCYHVHHGRRGGRGDADASRDVPDAAGR